MMLPGTTSLISVPEFAELTTVSLLTMCSARSRIPCRPKSVFAPIGDRRVNTYAVVAYTDGEVLRVCEFDLQLGGV